MMTNAIEIGTARLPCWRVTIPALAVLAGVLALTAFAAPAAAQSTVTLVSNTGQFVWASTYHVGDASGLLATQGFHTGDNPEGYTLSTVGIGLLINNFSGEETLTLHIFSSNSDSTANALLYTLSPPATPGSAISTGIVDFTAPVGSTLDPDTDYHVVVHGSGDDSNDAGLGQTGSNEETGRPNWTIHNFSRHNGAKNVARHSFRIRIKGTVVSATNTAPTAAAGAVTTNEDTPYTFTAADFNFADTDPGDALEGVKITVLPSAGTLRVDGTAIVSGDLPRTVSKADIDAGKLTYAPVANASGTATFSFKVNDGDADSASAYVMTVTITAVNDAPTVATTIPVQSATVDTLFSYQFPANEFRDVDGDALSYAAAQPDNSALPVWLTFANASRTFSGTPMAVDAGTVSVKVTASDGNGGSVIDEFDITVSAPPDTTPPTLTSAAVPATRSYIDLLFSENLRANSPAPNSAYTITADGIELEIVDTGNIRGNELRILYWPAVRHGQAVVLTYTDPTSGDDTHALQDYAGNYVATFTTGMNGVPAVTNNSTLGAPTPGAPTSLTATASGSTRIDLSWTAPSNNGGSAITGYRIEVSPNGIWSWTNRVANTNSTATTYAHTGLSAGTTRHYRVSAINANGTGTASGTDNATTDDASTTVPGAPTSLAATASGSTRIDLSWTAPSNNGGSAITGYRIEVSPNGISSWTNRVANTNSTATTYAHTGLSAGTTRHYRVSAINANGTGTASGTDNATTDDASTTVPGAPTSPAATASGSTRIDLSWTAPSNNGGSAITGYRIEVSPNGISSWTNRVANTNSTATTYAHTGLSAGTTRHYRVSAINANGTGTASGTDNATTDDPLTPPGAPEPLTATAGDGEVFLEWTAPADDGGSLVTGYEYRYAAGDGVPEDTEWQDAELSLEWTVTGLTNGQQYVFEVRALNGVGPGEAAVATATTLGMPGVPEPLTATAGDGEVFLEWTAPADDGGSLVTDYEYRYAAGDGVPRSTPWRSAGRILEKTVAALTNGQQYVFEVRALNGVGPGEAAVATATPLGMPGVPESLMATSSDAEIFLEWTAPADDGGSPVTGYEYRYAPGDGVPEDTEWQDAELSLEWTVTGLTNGQQYVFEVRALNGVDPGEAAVATATPLGMPGVPESLMATSNDGSVFLEWTAPADDGGSLVTGYEYRYAPGDGVPEDTEWQDAELSLEWTVTGLTNGQQYVFEVRALNGVGPGEAAVATATTVRLEAELFSTAAVATEGEPLVIGLRRSGGLAQAAHGYVGVTDSAVPEATAEAEGRSDGLGRHRLEFAPGATEATVTVHPTFDDERREGRVITATLESVEVEIDGAARTYELVTAELAFPVTDADAVMSVSDARADAESAALVFRMSLDRTRDVPVRVDYATENGTARAGEDYTAAAGTLVIEAGGREAAVEVVVLAAPHLTGERTLVLRLSNAQNARIGDGEAAGVIVRESALAQAWLSRFGRAASDHTAQAIARRLEAGQRETQVTVAGHRLDGLWAGVRSGGMPLGDFRLGGMSLGGLAMGNVGLGSAVNEMLMRAAGPGIRGLAAGRRPSGGADTRSVEEEGFRPALPDFGFRLPVMKEALLGSSFYVESGAQQDGGGGRIWAAWGDVAATHFEGAASGLALRGDVVTGTVGLDRQWRTLLVGLALSRSTGEGAYGAGSGTMTSTLTSVHPYLRYRLAERAQLWGATGWGQGGMLLTPGRGAAIETDLSNAMAALGGRAVLRRAGGESESSIEIAMRSDLLWTSTSSDEAGVLAEATGVASRGRLILEGDGRISGLGGVLRPSVEGGLRYDGGDAETGAGLEVGTGLDWTRGGLVLRINGRMLLAYSDDSYEEWGYGGSLIYESGAADGRGLRMQLGSSTGATASGVRSLWTLENASGLVLGGDMPFERHFDAEVGFGLGGGALWYPYFAADATGQKRLGLRLSSGQSLEVGLEFGRMGDRTRSAKDALVLRGAIRF